MSIPKSARFCNTNARDDINAMVQEMNTRIDAVYYAIAGGFKGPISTLRSAPVALTTGVSVNVCSTPSIVLTPGDWDVRGYVGFYPGGATNVAYAVGAISKTSATQPATDTRGVPTAGELAVQAVNVVAAGGAGYDFEINLGTYRTTVAAGTTLPLYLVAVAGFTVSTLSVFGSLEARLLK